MSIKGNAHRNACLGNTRLSRGALDGINDLKLSGVAAFEQSGLAVSTAGDVNGAGVSRRLTRLT